MRLADVQEAPPAQTAKWRFVWRRVAALLSAYGFREVHPSALEPIEVADRLSLDCLPLPDKMALRSDALASLGRLYAESALPEGFSRWALAGEIFDGQAEPPLRWRSWSAVSCALFGATDPAADAELLALASAVANDLRLTDAELVVSTLGAPGDFARFLEAVKTLSALACATCVASPDPLRFFTCEDDGCRALASTAPSLRQLVSETAKQRHLAVLRAAENLGLKVRDDQTLILDGRRYHDTIFELRATSASTGVVSVLRGGRRNSLVEQLGGNATPMVGLTIGVARAASCTPGEDESFESTCEVFFASDGEEARRKAARAAHTERGRGLRVDLELRDVPIDEQMQRAERLRARLVVIVREATVTGATYEVLDLRHRKQHVIAHADLSTFLRRTLR